MYGGKRRRKGEISELIDTKHNLTIIEASTWTYKGYGLLESIERIARNGLSDVELWADSFHLDPRNWTTSLKSLKKILRETQVNPYSIHAPFSNVMPEKKDSERIDEWVKLVEKTIEWAIELSSKILVIHPLTFGNLDDINYETTKHKTIEALKYFVQSIRNTNLKLAVENMHGLRKQRLGRDLEELINLVDDIGDAKLGICIDTSHSVFNNSIVSDDITKTGYRLFSVHVSDTFPGIGRDPHLLPGQGSINWNKTIKAAREIDFHGPWVLEVAGGGDPDKHLSFAHEVFNSFLRQSNIN